MENKGKGPLGDLIFQLKQWMVWLYNSCIMNFLEIPHFGRGEDFNSYKKKLLARVHGRFLCMDRPIPIDVYLIANIIGIPTDGMKHEQYLDDKMKENARYKRSKGSIWN
jgi:hypothetical protein